MKLEAFLGLVVRAMDELQLPFMLTGSLAASYHGSPRSTQDIDLVVEPDAATLLRLASTLRDRGLYVSDDAVSEAAQIRGQFNAIDPDSGWKADFIVRKDRPFSVAEFRRRRPIRLLNLDLAITRPEDLIVAKLEWAKAGDSERQIRDVAEIVAVQGSTLDIARVERWVGELSLDEQWELVRARSSFDNP